MTFASRRDALILLSHLLAAALGSWLWSHRTQVAATAASVAAGSADFIIHQLEWFMTAKPAGVKLHLQVAQFLGLLGIKYLSILQIIFSIMPTIEILELLIISLAITLPLVGLGTNKKFRCITAWCYFILTTPITFAYTVMALLYKWHLKATIHTWLAMRGKTPLVPSSLQLAFKKKAETGLKFNEKTKKKSPSSAVAAVETKGRPQPVYPTQLALASLLFMPCVLTLPTTAWFYAFWSAVGLVVYGVPMTVAQGFVVLSFFPGADLNSENGDGVERGTIMPDVLDILQKWVQGYVFTIEN